VPEEFEIVVLAELWAVEFRSTLLVVCAVVKELLDGALPLPIDRNAATTTITNTTIIAPPIILTFMQIPD
jgi:hypothetical protein